MNFIKHRSHAIYVYFLVLPMLLAQQSTPSYRNPALPIDKRVSELLGRMTLEEKIGQLESTWQNHSFDLLPDEFFVDDKGKLDEAKAKQALKNGLGQVTRPSENRGPREMAEFIDRLQRIAVENTRLGIPLMFHEECTDSRRSMRPPIHRQLHLQLAGTMSWFGECLTPSRWKRGRVGHINA